ncbi:hypothetical protein EW146_g7296 [Bondarzewia mesenterica]|uniref:RNA-binding protein vts1-like alpha-helical domain-containing protein n=1 Tax=Bondarzewia mesenterica TaxID=1095465 RepID=A0A4S4LLC0_9AGAM|nr:hypothetical protein EW146_g7296 [Bondarzewia mesenterica]
MALRPPSSPSPVPSPSPVGNGKPVNSRASMGPAARTPGGSQGFNLASPRPGGGPTGGRPTSELLGSAGMFQNARSHRTNVCCGHWAHVVVASFDVTVGGHGWVRCFDHVSTIVVLISWSLAYKKAEAIDQWFENLQNYEVTLEEMAAASLDVNFKEELSAIEQWFKVLSEAERTAALYSLLQHSTQVQIRFFITVLQQMARADPMTALLSPAVGGSMQNQMEAKLASLNLKSPGLKSPMPNSPSARTFGAGANANRQSLAFESAGASFLSPESCQQHRRVD